MLTRVLLTGQAVLRRALVVLACVSVRGWTVLGLAVGALVLGGCLSWRELSYLGFALAAVFMLSALLTIGRNHLEVSLQVQPRRMVVGAAASAELVVHNRARWPFLSGTLGLPVGANDGRIGLPVILPGQSHEELVAIPSSGRGVIVVGPATTERGDPFGLVRRRVSWARPTEVFVLPRTVALPPLGEGLLRDLEGLTSLAMSSSDLAFHTLREYAPGDDHRHIHWRSTAKLAGSGRTAEFMVRQFQDTRRSHVGIVVDTVAAHYADEDEFELAVAAAASVARRAVLDEMDLTVVGGGFSVIRAPKPASLDVFARIQTDPLGVAAAAARGAEASPDLSSVFIVSGSQVELRELERAARQFSGVVSVVGLRADREASPSIRSVGQLTLVSVPDLSDLGVGVGKVTVG